ncbi:MAG: hypothetical protein GF353_09160, partial [Candidatus Lokiarchaeota archaeon]|nr:hypothetical protein [Candidatus Lokiarchaeota archaeon]
MQKVKILFWIIFILLAFTNLNFSQEKEFKLLENQNLEQLSKKELDRGIEICNDVIDEYKDDASKKKLVTRAFLLKGKMYRQMGREHTSNASAAFIYG